MSPEQHDKLDQCIMEVTGFAAVLDVIHSHLDRNAAASAEIMRGTYWKESRVNILTDTEARAVDFVMHRVLQAVDALSECWLKTP